jgi:hypothetical protein
MDLTRVPEHRIAPLAKLNEALQAAQRIVLITHVNADGDGAGSEAAVAAWLQTLGKQVHITNATTFPKQFRYLVDDGVVLDHSDASAARAIRAADLVFVLDTGEPKRIGRHMDAALTRPVVVLDHHPAAVNGFDGLVVVLDTEACATGEHIKEATFTVRKAGKGQQEFLIIKMNDIIITGVAPSGAGDGAATAEHVALQFAKVDLEYKPQKPDGSLDAGLHFKYDIKGNKEG